MLRLLSSLSVAMVIAFLAACGDSRPAESPSRYRPPAFHPEQFPDIPLFPISGYELDPNVDQLAMTFAGGSVRRFEIAMIQRSENRADPPEAVLSRYDLELPPLGWVRTGAGRWSKGDEQLLIEAGRSGGATTVRFHLRPGQRDTR